MSSYFILAVVFFLEPASTCQAFNSFVPSAPVTSWAAGSKKRFNTMIYVAPRSPSGSWGIGDDWSSLSLESDNGETTTSLYSPDELNEDPAALAAKRMEMAEALRLKRESADEADPVAADAVPAEEEEERIFVEDAVDTILHYTDPSDPPLYDTASSMEAYAKSVHFADDAGKEIGLLVRCNQAPDTLLVEEGRALPPLTDEERYDVSQLMKIPFKRKDNESNDVRGVNKENVDLEPTKFFNDAVAKIFMEHSRIDELSKKERVLDRGGLSRWMSKSLGGNPVGMHHKLISAVISRYSTYGTGHLSLEEFRQLYADAVVAGWKKTKKQSSRGPTVTRSPKIEQATVDSVWRDFSAHGILSPVELERKMLQEELDAKVQSHPTSHAVDTLMDECEIIEWNEDNAAPQWSIDGPGGTKQRRSSHELVELASDKDTPRRIRDGQFVFIDEESCIGCTQCAQIAPASFVMLESGRARSFQQSNSRDVPIAVSACPVNCMHNVAFHELKEMETQRDSGDGRTDHRHLGRPTGHTPLWVAGIDSDNNHKSSWYHYLKQKCAMSASCPKRGCYDCPHYSAKGENPYFKERQRKAQKMRVKDILASGEADMWRKTADL